MKNSIMQKFKKNRKNLKNKNMIQIFKNRQKTCLNKKNI